MLSSTADRTVVAPIINGMLLFVQGGTPTQKLPIWSTVTMTTVLTTFVASSQPFFVINVNPATVFVDAANFTAPGTGTGPVAVAVTYAAAVTTTPAQIVTAAAEALAAQQTAVAAVLAATLPATFNLLNLPPDVKTRHLHQLDPSYLLTQSDMVPFLMATEGVCLPLSHLDPPIGTSVTRQPD